MNRIRRPALLAAALLLGALAAPRAIERAPQITPDLRAAPAAGAALVPPHPRAAARLPGQPSLASGSLLVAARELSDPNFHQTVVLLLEYGPAGALGVVLNRPATFAMADVLGDLPLPGEAGWAERVKVRLGGPVDPRRIFLLLRADESPPEARQVTARLYASASMRTLEWAGTHLPAEAVRVYAGYAGWGPRQLDGEVEAGGWHLLPAAAEQVFAPPAELWPRLIRSAAGTWVRETRSKTMARRLAPAAPGAARGG